jgi:hypothetical protein
MSNDRSLPNFNQVNLAPIGSFGLSPSRNQDLPLIPTPPLPVRTFPMLPPPTPEVLAPLQGPQIPLRGITDQHNVSAMPTVPAIGPTTRNVRLAAEADAAIAASSSLNPDLRAVIHELRRVVRVPQGLES